MLIGSVVCGCGCLAGLTGRLAHVGVASGTIYQNAGCGMNALSISRIYQAGGRCCAASYLQQTIGFPQCGIPWLRRCSSNTPEYMVMGWAVSATISASVSTCTRCRLNAGGYRHYHLRNMRGCSRKGFIGTFWYYNEGTESSFESPFHGIQTRGSNCNMCARRI